MKKLIVLLVVVFLSGCAIKPVTNFEECVAAGNPVMESYPRQCRADGQTFVEVIEEPVQSGPIGGQRDEHGCLGPAGYTWNEDVGACIREWELTEIQRDAAKRAVNYVGRSDGLAVTEVLVARCPGCFEITLDKSGERFEVVLEDWKVKDIN